MVESHIWWGPVLECLVKVTYTLEPVVILKLQWEESLKIRTARISPPIHIPRHFSEKPNFSQKCKNFSRDPKIYSTRISPPTHIHFYSKQNYPPKHQPHNIFGIFGDSNPAFFLNLWPPPSPSRTREWPRISYHSSSFSPLRRSLFGVERGVYSWSSLHCSSFIRAQVWGLCFFLGL